MSYFLLCALRRAAQRAFIASDSLRRPSAVKPPFLRDLVEPAPALLPPLRLAQRALAAAESFARVAADMERLRRPPPFEEGEEEERALEPPAPVPKIPERRFSND